MQPAVAKLDGAEIDAEVAASIKAFSRLARDTGPRRQKATSLNSDFLNMKAQMISAHFLLPAGARIVDMGCGRGEVTALLAKMNPRVAILGVDHDKAAIAAAKRAFSLPNLSFVAGDIGIPGLEDGFLDGIVNSNVLHQVYSEGGYDPALAGELIARQARKLKVGGTMLIRDYVKPPSDEFVLLELPDVPSSGASPAQMSDADLLISFSQTARPMAWGSEGFFLQEKPARRPGTRLFRLEHKWALEFVHRKNYRDTWDAELKREYTFYTWEDYRRELMRQGLRMVYSAPYANPWVVKNRFEKQFQLYDEEGKALPPPSTNSFIVAQKVADRKGLELSERSRSAKPVSNLKIIAVRDKKNGEVHEIVKSAEETCDVIPYRPTPDGRVVMYVRAGYPRPIVNAAQREVANLDGKRWSGHLVEPLSMDTLGMTPDAEQNKEMIFDHLREKTGLAPRDEWHLGAPYFPAPDRIDEAIEPVFVRVENPQKTSWPMTGGAGVHFADTGMMMELDAADILRSARVGLLPDSRLEIYARELMAMHETPPSEWSGDELPDIPRQKDVVGVDPQALLDEIPAGEFEEVKDHSTRLKLMKSQFVEEGREGGLTRGISAQDVEFVVSEDGAENIALVLPLSRDWDNNLLVAVEPKMMPVPDRMGGTGATLAAPTFVLPQNVRTMADARAWVAAKFEVPQENVGQLGESYFVHTGITPQRVYPFYVTSARPPDAGQKWRYAPLKALNAMMLGMILSKGAFQLMKPLSMVQNRLPDSHDAGVQHRAENARYKKRELSTQKVGLDGAVYGVPSRVLGQRPPPPQQQAPQQSPPAQKQQTVQKKRPPARALRRRPRMARVLASMGQIPQQPIELKTEPALNEINKSVATVAKKVRRRRAPRRRRALTAPMRPPI